MNAFIPQNPRVVINVDTYGKVRVINNIDPDLVVEVVEAGQLATVGAGLPFDNCAPRAVPQVLAAKKH